MKNEMLEKKNDSRSRFVDIDLENVAVAAARVVDALIRGGKNVDVYKTLARIIVVRGRGASQARRTLTNLKMRQIPYSQRPVWGIIKHVFFLICLPPARNFC